MFGYKLLYGFWTTDEPDTVILSIGRNLDEWEELILTTCSSSSTKDDLFVLIVHVLAEKVCSNSVLQPNQIQIITRTLGEPFITRLSSKFGQMICNFGSALGSSRSS